MTSLSASETHEALSTKGDWFFCTKKSTLNNSRHLSVFCAIASATHVYPVFVALRLENQLVEPTVVLNEEEPLL